MSYVRFRQRNLLNIVKYPIITSKLGDGKKASTSNIARYSFAVDSNSNKAMIKLAIEELFAVKVISVNTSLFPLKNCCLRGRFGISRGRRVRYKRAIVRLASGDSIDRLDKSK
jgi:large subunit ribosomal protein L23